MTNIKGFLARGSQAVTYGVGTWHAPMIVVGKQEVVFLVTQFTNGIADDDCQEVAFEAGEAGGFTISVPSPGSWLNSQKASAKL